MTTEEKIDSLTRAVSFLLTKRREDLCARCDGRGITFTREGPDECPECYGDHQREAARLEELRDRLPRLSPQEDK